jgi:hypothetical protein
MRSSLFWDVTQRRLVVSWRHFWTTYLSHLQGSSSPGLLRLWSTRVNEENDRQRTSIHKRLLRHVWFSCYLHSRCSVWFPACQHNFQLFLAVELRTISKFPGFTWISWQAFSTCCITCKSLIGSEQTKGFWFPKAKNPEDEGQGTVTTS